MPAPSVEILFFEGCPNVEAARALVQRIASEEGITLQVRLVEVTPDDAERLRFLGSPSVRVDGHDIEPGADQRTNFTFGCRVFRTAQGLSGEPASDWVRAPLIDSHR